MKSLGETDYSLVMPPPILQKRFFRYFLAIAAILLVMAFLLVVREKVNSTTVALAFLLDVLFIATFIGRNPALVASVIAVLCFNYYFLQPVGTWTIAEWENLIAWAAFTITAVTAGEISTYARRRADEAERQKDEIKRLYDELQIAFEKASEAEALRRSEKLKSALLDAVTHDLRTPLTSIKASVTTLLDSEGGHRTIELDAESRIDFLEVINEETDRLNQFIEGMVELARIESRELKTSWISLAEVVPNVLRRAAGVLQNRRVLLDLESDLPLIRVDEKALAEVIFTLVDNAAKYSPEDSPIEIAARKIENEMIEIAVSDEGRGIPEEWREKVFDKFFRVENKVGRLPKSRGTGLGLAIAKGIVEAHGGKIRAEENQNGKGARFVFTVPVGSD